MRLPSLCLPLALVIGWLADVAPASAQTAPPRSSPGLGLARLSDELQALGDRVRPAIVQVIVSGYAPTSDDGALLARKRGEGAGVLRYVAVRLD